MEVFTLILPVFGIMVTGYVVARLGILPETTGAVLIQFVYYVAIPALLFVVIAQEDLRNLFNPPFVVAFGASVVGVFVLVLLGALVWRGTGLASATMVATISVGSNTAIIGLPLLHSLFGHKALLLAAIASIIVVLLFLVQVLLLEFAELEAPDNKQSLLIHVRNTLLNPIILSTVLGVAYAVAPIDLPKIVADYMDLLGSALTPCALFAIGMSINPRAVLKSEGAVAFASIVKLVLLPVLVLGVAWVMNLDPLLAVAAVIAAALPTAKSEFIFAEQYHQSEDLVAGTISLTTAASVITLIVWLFILSHLYPGAFVLQ
ncbi:AEC family transporter [Bauldia sp.]|uniref:AEC family transporter n=1 Tax=Bauldia sp. TaxID=2575872 RepID=UPI003BAA4263